MYNSMASWLKSSTEFHLCLDFIFLSFSRFAFSCREMRLVGLTLALVVAGGQACTFLEGADQHISLMVNSIMILMVNIGP